MRTWRTSAGGLKLATITATSSRSRAARRNGAGRPGDSAVWNQSRSSSTRNHIVASAGPPRPLTVATLAGRPGSCRKPSTSKVGRSMPTIVQPAPRPRSRRRLDGCPAESQLLRSDRSPDAGTAVPNEHGQADGELGEADESLEHDVPTRDVRGQDVGKLQD